MEEDCLELMKRLLPKLGSLFTEEASKNTDPQLFIIAVSYFIGSLLKANYKNVSKEMLEDCITTIKKAALGQMEIETEKSYQDKN
jgi:hypothetical protein